ncbi:hypothetical protein F2Q70_00010859 [Brassica cretica]|uniref:Uncharacterized protein n=1 Tax=Brassica cretica TaxID=69181 RepID=A0A8S9M339_BRACR|nr:hypothetical protein F2Q70_00010859 [Brassica cretica]
MEEKVMEDALCEVLKLAQTRSLWVHEEDVGGSQLVETFRSKFASPPSEWLVMEVHTKIPHLILDLRLRQIDSRMSVSIRQLTIDLCLRFILDLIELVSRISLVFLILLLAESY